MHSMNNELIHLKSLNMTRKGWRGWNRQALADWIELEKTAQNLSYAQLEQKMGLPYGTVDWWRLALADRLSPSSIAAIARYRRWSEYKVKIWLDLEVGSTSENHGSEKSDVDKEQVKPALISRLKSNLAEELSEQQIDELVDLLLDLTLLSLSHTANKLGGDRIAQQHQIAREFWNLVNWLDQSRRLSALVPGWEGSARALLRQSFFYPG